MMVQDESSVQSVTLILARLYLTKLTAGSMTPTIPILNSYGFTVQPVLEKLQSPEPSHKLATTAE